MLPGPVEDQLSSSFAHHLEISRNSSNAIQDDFLQRRFIIRYYAHLLADLELFCHNSFYKCNKVVFHEVDIHFPFADRLLADVMHYFKSKCILVAETPETF